MTNNELKQIRLSMSLTQSELAKLLHVSLSSIARWERGIMSIPEHMAELLGYKAREQKKYRWGVKCPDIIYPKDSYMYLKMLSVYYVEGYDIRRYLDNETSIADSDA